MKNLKLAHVILRSKWTVAVVTLGAVVASGGAGVKWG